jgi:hypothetical protein
MAYAQALEANARAATEPSDDSALAGSGRQGRVSAIASVVWKATPWRSAWLAGEWPRVALRITADVASRWTGQVVATRVSRTVLSQHRRSSRCAGRGRTSVLTAPWPPVVHLMAVLADRSGHPTTSGHNLPFRRQRRAPALMRRGAAHVEARICAATRCDWDAVDAEELSQELTAFFDPEAVSVRVVAS